MNELFMIKEQTHLRRYIRKDPTLQLSHKLLLPDIHT